MHESPTFSMKSAAWDRSLSEPVGHSRINHLIRTFRFRTASQRSRQMEKLRVLPHEWVVVCDGRKALILENLGDEKFPNLRCREEHDHPDPPTRELGTAPPGKCTRPSARHAAPPKR